jgi:hypothetical protein
LVEHRPPARFVPDVLGAELAIWGGSGRVLVCGDGASRYRDLWSSLARVDVAGPLLDAPSPAVLARMALAALAAGEELAPGPALKPLYLREPDARINWSRRAPQPSEVS